VSVFGVNFVIDGRTVVLIVPESSVIGAYSNQLLHPVTLLSVIAVLTLICSLDKEESCVLLTAT
jgi:hypothetical protein